MPPLSDPEILKLFHAALSKRHVTDYITIKDVALEWARDNLAGFTLKSLAKLMYDELQAGVVPDRVRETRPEWNDRDYHYDFRVPWSGRLVYVETILRDDDPTDPIVDIVSIHHA